jgi:hypothetical protein
MLLIILIFSSFNLKAQCGFRSDYIKWVCDSSMKSDSFKVKTNHKKDSVKSCQVDTLKSSKETKWVLPIKK